MNDFDYDAMQKKRIASGARHRKCGSKSKRCTLPQDSMTAKQLKERNGEMSTYNLNKPMSWGTFKAMPDDLKREYIIGLRDKYNASGSKIAAMMGVSAGVVRALTRELGLAEQTRRNMSREQDVAWADFLNPQPMVTLDPLEEIQPAEAPVEAPVKTGGCAINNGFLTFTGKAPDIAIAIMKFLGDREYRISVDFVEV